MFLTPGSRANRKRLSLAGGQAVQPAGSMTFLGTLTTTSGTTQTLSGLTLTNYKYLFIDVSGVNTGNSVLTLASQNLCAAISGSGNSGLVLLSLVSGRAWAAIGIGANTSYTASTGYSTATTSLVFGCSNTFSAGTIKVYGVQ